MLPAALLGSGTAFARTAKGAAVKTGVTANDKTATDNSAKTVIPENKNPVTGDDSAATDPEFRFYKSKKLRPISLKDIFVSVGGGFLLPTGGSSAPYKKGITLNANYTVALMDKYLTLEFNNNADFMYAPDLNWFSKAYALPKSSTHNIGIGFNDEFTLGLQAVVVGSRKLTLTAGTLAGATLTNLPSKYVGEGLRFIFCPISLCYGLKTSLYIGDRFYCFGQYANTLTRKVVVAMSAPASDIPQQRQMPVDFGSVRIGVGYVIKPWW